ncbi:MAG: IS110 family transposase [Rhodobiaceae bacterium]|jgi:transposase|nr:IS110 family transposase [Rhodobiaceae bacterium]
MSRTQDQINHPVVENYAGIDVSKDKLDFAIHGSDVFLTVPNDRRGIQKLIRQCTLHNVQLVVLEPTGKFHRAAHEHFHDADIAVAAVNPFRSRKFADSLGQLAKTDKIDAQVLARYAAVINPRPSEPVLKQYNDLRELQAARRQLVDEIGDLKRRLKASVHALAIRQLKARLKLAETHKSAVEGEVHKIIQSETALKSRFQILTSIPNIGATTAALMLADLSELGRVNCRQIAALAGVAPMNWDSGTRQGSRITRGGRRHIRKALYMCAVSAIGRQGALAKTYKHLIQRGKPPKVALTAIMRKLVVLANTLIAEQRCWQPCKP